MKFKDLSFEEQERIKRFVTPEVKQDLLQFKDRADNLKDHVYKKPQEIIKNNAGEKFLKYLDTLPGIKEKFSKLAE